MHPEIIAYKEYCLSILNRYAYVDIWNQETFVTETGETFVDLETSGLCRGRSRNYILEIYACKKDKRGNIIGTFSTYVKDEQLKKIASAVSIKNKITMDTIKYAPSTFEVISAFKMFLQDDIVIAHNSGFDWTLFLKWYFDRFGLYANNIVLCTKTLCSKIYPGFNSHRLTDIAGYLNIPFSPFAAHGAKADVIMMMDVYDKICRPKKVDPLYTEKLNTYQEHFKSRSALVAGKPSIYDFNDFKLIDWGDKSAVVEIEGSPFKLVYEKDCRQWDFSSLAINNGHGQGRPLYRINQLSLNQQIKVMVQKGEANV